MTTSIQALGISVPAGISPVGEWVPNGSGIAFGGPELEALITRVRQPVHIVWGGPQYGVGAAADGTVRPWGMGGGALPLLGTLPALFPEWLGDRSFLAAHGVRFCYIAGEMANGIATKEMVIAMARAQMLGFFGSAGLSPDRVDREIAAIQGAIGPDSPSWGSNLIHSPEEPALEMNLVDLYVRRGVCRVSASAFMALQPSVVRYAAAGLHRGPDGSIQRKHHLFAKVSRPEVARAFMSPPPAAMLAELVATGRLTREEADLAAQLPVAEDITAEADSGGHTDNRPLTVLLPAILTLRDELTRRFGFTRPIRVGAAGGLGTPEAVAAAFSMGAAYVMTGSVNQAAVESGLSPAGKDMLARAGLADVMMAPAADMFEWGAKVQVLKRGTMFGVRATYLYDLYNAHGAVEELSAADRARLEKEIFRKPLAEVERETRDFFAVREPAQWARAEREPRHKMALLFRWYLGKASRWAIEGDPERQSDYQIWCGPAMGAFNTWTAGTFLADPGQRTAVQIARNLLEGAAVVTRAQQARNHGLAVPSGAFRYVPQSLGA